jgi:glutaconate CoA-transferase subunit A
VNPAIRSVTCPYTGESSRPCPRSGPTSTIVHAQKATARQRADRGHRRRAKEAALARASAHRHGRGDRPELDAHAERADPAALGVHAVAHVPGGAYPSYAQGYYRRDNGFYQRWDAIAREREPFLAWMRRHVLDTADHARSCLARRGRREAAPLIALA